MNLNFLKAQVRLIAEDEFSGESLNKLFLKMDEVLDPDLRIENYLLQIELEQSNELGIGFFDLEYIYDFTISKDQIYHFKQKVRHIRDTDFQVGRGKATLRIFGEKKLNYSVLMPGSPIALLSYQDSIKKLINKK